MKNAALGIAILFAASQAVSFAQSHPTPKVATDITDEEVKEVLKNAPPKIDQQIRVVDMGAYNLSVGVLRYQATKDAADGTAPCILHHQVAETYVITSGGGTLVTGSTVMNPRETPKDSEINTTLVGPSASARIKLSDAQVRKVKPGDVIIIPADVCHGWVGISDQVTYLSVRPDTDRILPAGYVNPAIKK